MTLEPWVIVVAGCTAVGAVALAARQLLRLIASVQERRLQREGRALQRWWGVLGDVPADVLTPPLRRLLGRIMTRCLHAAARVGRDHPYLRGQRDEINRFIGGHTIGNAIRSARGRGQAQARERHMPALQELLTLLDHSAADRLVSTVELASARSAVSRALNELEFLAARQPNLEADALRRMTRALDSGAAPWGRQSSSAFPTQ